jgi:hypothetical protein
MFGEWYQKTNKTEDTNKLTLLAILHNTRLATGIKLLDTASKGRTGAMEQRLTAVLRSIAKDAFADSFQKLYERCQPCVVKDGDYFEGQ